MSSQSTLSEPITRRTLARGAGWALPVLAMGATAPAMAASLAPLCPSCLATTPSISTFGVAGGGTTWSTSAMNLNLRLNAHDCSTTPYNYSDVSLKLTSADVTLWVPTGTVSSPGATGSLWTVSLTPTIAPSSFTSINKGSGFTGFIFSSGSLSIPTSPSLPANGTYDFTSGTAQTAAGIKTVCYNGQLQGTVNGVVSTRTIRICQDFCLQQSRSWQQTSSTDIQVGYDAQSCGAVTVTCGAIS